MQFKSIILTIAASLALAQAAVVPRAASGPFYDLCLDEFSKFNEVSKLDLSAQGDAVAALQKCSTCFFKSVSLCGPIYAFAMDTNENVAKSCYTTTMATCKTNTPTPPAAVAPPKTPVV